MELLVVGLLDHVFLVELEAEEFIITLVYL
jgi:hypothetical protein